MICILTKSNKYFHQFLDRNTIISLQLWPQNWWSPQTFASAATSLSLGYKNGPSIPPDRYIKRHDKGRLTGCCGTCVWSRSSRGSFLLFGAGRHLSGSCTRPPPPGPHHPPWTGTAHSGIPATRDAPQLRTRNSRGTPRSVWQTTYFPFLGLSLLFCSEIWKAKVWGPQRFIKQDVEEDKTMDCWTKMH